MRFKNKKIIAIIISLGLGFVVFGSLAGFALAENTSTSWDEYTPLAPLPGTTNEEGTTNIQTYIPGIFKLAIGIAGVLAVLMIIIGGVEYITTDAIQGKSEGKERIQNALWGLVLVLVSWILLYTINPKLTDFNLNVETTTSTNQDGEQTNESDDYSSGETTGDNAGDNTDSGDNETTEDDASEIDPPSEPISI
ncbi:MAG: pilin [Patescibacteria group bacterium]